MNITFVLLSPTFGMHQYTADLANRAVRGWGVGGQGLRVQLVTTTTLPKDRYSPAVQIHTPVATHGTGFSREGLDIAAYRRVLATVLSAVKSTQLSALSPQPSVHFTGVHAWNLPLVHALRRRGIPVIHTLHDLDPHHGVRHPALIRLWNRLIIASGCHLLVHGRRYRDQLLAAGVTPERVTYTPLLHGFLGAEQPWPPDIPDSRFQIPDSRFNILFFGRVETYKGVGILLAAWEALITEPRANSCNSWQNAPRLVIAGPVARDVTLPHLPPGVELRDRRIGDDEAEALFRSAAMLVLPYLDASQSALVAAAYAFSVPVIVSDAGALAEYVVHGETGWTVPAGDANALSAALRDALADPARLRRMGAAGRAWFAARRAEEQAGLAGMYSSLACRSGILLR